MYSCFVDHAKSPEVPIHVSTAGIRTRCCSTYQTLVFMLFLILAILMSVAFLCYCGFNFPFLTKKVKPLFMFLLAIYIAVERCM